MLVMRHSRSKVRNNYIHTRRRIAQRYGVDVDRAAYKRLCGQIKNSRSVYLGRQTPSRTVHQVSLDGLKLIVVYNSNVGNICTVLYPGRVYRVV